MIGVIKKSLTMIQEGRHCFSMIKLIFLDIIWNSGETWTRSVCTTDTVFNCFVMVSLNCF